MQCKLATFSSSWSKCHEVFTPGVAIFCEKTMAREGAGDRQFLIYLYSKISLFAANNSFDLRKQFSQKSWTSLLKLLQKNLEKNVWINLFLEPVTLLKMNFFLGIFQGINIFLFLGIFLFKSFRGLLLPWNFHAFTEHLLVCL